MLDDQALISLWLHGRPTTTARAYRSELESLRDRLVQTGPNLYKPGASNPGAKQEVVLAGATLEQLQAHLAAIAGKAPRTQGRAIAAIRSFYRFHVKVGTLTADPSLALTAPKVPRDLSARILLEADIAKLICAGATPSDRTFLQLVYGAGLRVSEACALYWRQVVPRDNGEGQVTVTGKGGKTRSVLIPADLYRALVDLKVNAKPSDPVFPSPADPTRPIVTRTALRIVKRAAAAAGLSSKVSTHWLRHSHASHALDNGAPITLVRDTLGHASLATTNLYAHARPNDGSARYLGKGKTS